MFKDQVYEPCQMATLFKSAKHIGLNLRPVQPSISERTLLISVLHMMLGFPSDIFFLKNNNFYTKQQLIQMTHITHEAISKLMTFFISIGNQMNFLRQYIRQLSNCQHKILQAFGVGLQKKVIQFESDLSQRLKTLQQQQGQIIRNESQYHISRNNPTTIIGLSVLLAAEHEVISRISSIISLLPPLTKLTTEDYQNAGLFLLNIYYQECQKEYLMGIPFKLHSVFGQCLKVYVQVCKSWITLSEKELLANKNIGFFVDLNIALSIDKQKMFDSKKTIKREKIPYFINSNYKHIFQLGKTVQFIKLYFKQQQLFQFMNFFDIQGEFKPLQQFINNLINSKTTYFSLRPQSHKKNITISSRISKNRAPNKAKIQSFQNNPFDINQQPSQFFYLRSHIAGSIQPNKIQALKIKEMKKNSSSMSMDQKLSINELLIKIMNDAMNKLSFKCQAILKKSQIKDSIQQTLRGIKQFILLGQGDFVQQFLELSQTLLQKPIEKISRNNVERIIQEAIKNSAAHKQPEQMRQSVTFSFVRLDQGSIKGWRAFSLAFRSQTPVTCIFNTLSMQGYESIGNLLFNLRRCEQILVSYWRKSFLGKAAKFMQARNAIHHFVCALQSYLFAQIEQTWCSLLTQFESCDSVLSLIQANETTLQALRELTVENKPLCSSMLSLVKIIDRLQNINKQCEQDHEYKVISDLEQIWSWFLSMLDQAKQIRNFSDSFDFKLNY